MSAWTKANPSPGYAKGKKKEGAKEPGNKCNKKWKSEISAMTIRNDEVLEALITSQQAHLEAMQAQASAASGKLTLGPASLAKESIRASERSRISLLRLQSIQKTAVKPAGKPPDFPAP